MSSEVDAESARIAWVPTLLAWLVPAAALCLLARRYLPFFSDDGFISLRYSERLLAGEGLTWTAGERVEGYSNLLWVLLCAALGSVMDLITAARVLGLGAGLAMIAGLVRLFPARSWSAAIPAATGGLVIALSGPVAAWSIGGLEANLLGALWIWSIVSGLRTELSTRQLLLASIPAALACWTRPDGFLVAAIVGAAIAVRACSRPCALAPAMRKAAIYGALPLVFVLVQLAFRLVYYGDYVPNPAHIKLGFSAARAAEGAEYVGSALSSLIPILGLVAIGLFAALRGHGRAMTVVAAASVVIWSLYLVVIGGDIFPAYRHFVPAVGCLALIAAAGMRWFLSEVRGAGVMAPLALGLFVLAAHGNRQLDDPRNQAASNEFWEWGGEPIGTLFREGFAEEDPLLAVDAAGSLPYFSRLRALDMFGLCDRHIATQAPESGRRIGHDHGDGEYVLAQRPDIVVFRLPWGGAPTSVSGKQMLVAPSFKQEYVRVEFLGLVPFTVRNRSFVRIEGRVGVKRSDGLVEIPAYLFTGEGLRGHSTAGGHPGRSIGLCIDANRLGGTPPISLDAGTWSVVVDPPGALVAVDVRLSPLIGREPGAFEVTSATRVRLVMESGDVQTLVGAVRLERLERLDSPPFQYPVPGWFHDARVALDTLQAWPTDALDSTFSTWSLTPGMKRIVMRGHAVLSTAGGDPEAPETLEDRPTTELRSASSPELVLPERAALALEIRGEGEVGLRLIDAGSGRILRAWHGDGEGQFRRIVSDLAEYAGRTVLLRLEEESAELPGHASIRNVELLRF